jgi:hypothetical protein
LRDVTWGEYYTVDDVPWGEYMGWLILVFTEIESH